MKRRIVGIKAILPRFTGEHFCLKALVAFRYCLVPFPMNPEAQITGVKGLKFEAQLRELIAYSK